MILALLCGENTEEFSYARRNILTGLDILTTGNVGNDVTPTVVVANALAGMMFNCLRLGI